MTAFVPSESIQLAPAIAGCLEACRRCESLVHAVLGEEAPVAGRAYRAIGRHLRHCADHFVCLLRGLDSGIVDYDARDRSEDLETDPERFLDVLGSVGDRLRSLDAEGVDRPVKMRQEAAPGGQVRMLQSNLERELIFVSSHTIHHIAIMVLLAREQGAAVPTDFGVAFSTATHLERSASASVPAAGGAAAQFGGATR